MHHLSLCVLGNNNGSDVCLSSECPGETVHLPRPVSVVDVSITDSFVLLVDMYFKFAISCPKKKPILARYQSIFYTN